MYDCNLTVSSRINPNFTYFVYCLYFGRINIAVHCVFSLIIVDHCLCMLGSVLNIGYRRYTGRQNYVPDIGYRVIYRDMVLNTG